MGHYDDNYATTDADLEKRRMETARIQLQEIIDNVKWSSEMKLILHLVKNAKLIGQYAEFIKEFPER